MLILTIAHIENSLCSQHMSKYFWLYLSNPSIIQLFFLGYWTLPIFWCKTPSSLLGTLKYLIVPLPPALASLLSPLGKAARGILTKHKSDHFPPISETLQCFTTSHHTNAKAPPLPIIQPLAPNVCFILGQPMNCGHYLFQLWSITRKQEVFSRTGKKRR